MHRIPLMRYEVKIFDKDGKLINGLDDIKEFSKVEAVRQAVTRLLGTVDFDKIIVTVKELEEIPKPY